MNQQGNIPGKYIWEFAGNPTGIPTSVINPPLGALVVDSTTGTIYRKTTGYANNSGFVTLGNATVPSNAQIQPPQAFVNNVFKLTQLFGNLDMSSQGITHMDPDAIGDYATNYSAVQASGTTIDLSGNALSSAEVNAILAACVADSIPQVFTLNLSGIGMGAPTEQGITDKATLIGAGWTVTTN